MLTAMGEETDRIIGLELGADDYVPSRSIRASCWRASAPCCAAPATRRNTGASQPCAGYRFAGWTLEPARRRLLNPEGVEVPLTGGEYDLLVALVERANRVLTRDMLLDLLRGRQAGPFDRAIDVAVSRLRRKLEDDGRNAQLIKTVRGGGYVLAATVERGARRADWRALAAQPRRAHRAGAAARPVVGAGGRADHPRAGPDRRAAPGAGARIAARAIAASTAPWC